MSAKWAKNEVTAAKRRCGMIIKYLDASGLLVPAPPGTDFIGAGAVFVCGATAPKAALALGTLTNQRRPLVVADFTITATDTVNDRVTKVAHGLETGDGLITPTTTAGGLVLGTPYYAIKFDADQFSLALSPALAYAGTKVDITASVNGMIFQDLPGSTERGWWGHFEYEATIPETNHDAPETLVVVDGIVGGLDFRRMNDAGAYTTVTMDNAAAAFDQISENGKTYGQQIRIIYRTLAAKFTKVGNDYVYRNDADSLDSHTGTVTSAGRTARNIINPD